jgi:GGDEF domain-containing protein
VEVSHRLTSACDGSFLARLGADEFIVVSPDGPQPAVAQELCNRLAAVLDQPVRIDAMRSRAVLRSGPVSTPATAPMRIP